MNNARAKQLAINLSAALIIIILALIPFHAFLTVWMSSLIGHYTALRLWKEFLLVIILLCSAFIVITDKKLRKSINKLLAYQVNTNLFCYRTNLGPYCPF